MPPNSSVSARPRIRNKPWLLVTAPPNRVGRVQRAVKRAFISYGAGPLSTGDLMQWAYPGCERYTKQRYAIVRRAAERWCVKLGRGPKGAWLWKLKDSER